MGVLRLLKAKKPTEIKQDSIHALVKQLDSRLQGTHFTRNFGVNNDPFLFATLLGAKHELRLAF